MPLPAKHGKKPGNEVRMPGTTDMLCSARFRMEQMCHPVSNHVQNSLHRHVTAETGTLRLRLFKVSPCGPTRRTCLLHRQKALQLIRHSW